MKELVWLIPVLPLVGAFLNGVVLRNRLSKMGVGWVAFGAVYTLHSKACHPVLADREAADSATRAKGADHGRFRAI